MFKNILVALDESPHSDRALQAAVGLLAQAGPEAKLTALRVVPDYHFPEYSEAFLSGTEALEKLRGGLLETGQKRLQAQLQRCGAPASTTPVVKLGEAAYPEVLRFAKAQPFDLVVMGSRGHGSVAGALLGSQTHRVLAGVQQPVLVVH